MRRRARGPAVEPPPVEVLDGSFEELRAWMDAQPVRLDFVEVLRLRRNRRLTRLGRPPQHVIGDLRA